MKGACILESPLENSHPTGNTHTGVCVEQEINFYFMRLLRFQGLSFEAVSVTCRHLPVYLVVSSFSLEVPENLYLELGT